MVQEMTMMEALAANLRLENTLEVSNIQMFAPSKIFSTVAVKEGCQTSSFTKLKP